MGTFDKDHGEGFDESPDSGSTTSVYTPAKSVPADKCEEHGGYDNMSHGVKDFGKPKMFDN
jgi:hypothetical protein